MSAFGDEGDMEGGVAATASVVTDPKGGINRLEIPQRSSPPV